jgi:hypothetical protein
MHFDDFARRYSAQCPKRPTQAETRRQSARNSRSTGYFRGTLHAAKSFFQGDFSAMSVSRCDSWHNASLRCYNGHNAQARTALSTVLLQNVKKVCSPKPLSCPPRAVETPVCGLIPRTPAPCCEHSSGGRQRGFEGCVKNDFSGCRRNRLGSWDEKTSCVAFSASIQGDF